MLEYIDMSAFVLFGTSFHHRAPLNNNRHEKRGWTHHRFADRPCSVLTVLCVCVAACVLAVCVATVMVVDLARKRGLVLFHAKLMVRGGSAERETADDRVHSKTKEKRPRPKSETRSLALRTETRKTRK